MTLLLALHLWICGPSFATGPEEQLAQAIQEIGALTPEQLAERFAASPDWFEVTYPLLSSGPTKFRGQVATLRRSIEVALGKKKPRGFGGMEGKVEAGVPLANQASAVDFNLLRDHGSATTELSGADAQAFKEFYAERGLDFQRLDLAIDFWARHLPHAVRDPRKGIQARIPEWYEAVERTHARKYQLVQDLQRDIGDVSDELILEAARREGARGGQSQRDYEDWGQRYRVEVARIREQLPSLLGDNPTPEALANIAPKVKATNPFFVAAAMNGVTLSVAEGMAKNGATTEAWLQIMPFLMRPAKLCSLFGILPVKDRDGRPPGKVRKAAPFVVAVLVNGELNTKRLNEFFDYLSPDDVKEVASTIQDFDQFESFERRVRSQMTWTIHLENHFSAQRARLNPSGTFLGRVRVFLDACGKWLTRSK